MPIVRTCCLAACAVLALLAPAGHAADAYEPPPNYYDGAVGTGDTLKANLRSIIFFDWREPEGFRPEHRLNSYIASATAFKILDEDPDNPNNFILAYTGQSLSKNSGNFNREHTWPRSLGVGETQSSRAFADYHMLRGCNPSVNSSRSNRDFGTLTGQWDPNLIADNSKAWSLGTGVQFRGEMARTAFYAATRYEAGDETGTDDLELTRFQGGGGMMGDLDELLFWHYDEPPTQRERRRNHLVYSNYQGNRNPFVDQPQFVWTIFGEPEFGPNNSQLHLTPTTTTTGGTLDLTDIGDFIVDDAPPVTFNIRKSFTHPTTFQLSTSGGADVTQVGSQAQPDLDRQFTVSQGSPQIVPVTARYIGPPGEINARVFVENTDLSSAGTGRGSADGNDTFVILGTAFDAAEVSLEPGQFTDFLVVEFGDIEQDSGQHRLNVPIYALETVPGFTAGADIDRVELFGAGEPELSYNAGATPQFIPAGQTINLAFDLNTSSPTGLYALGAEIFTSDQDIPGASAPASSSVTVIVRATIVLPAITCPGSSEDVTGYLTLLDSDDELAEFTPPATIRDTFDLLAFLATPCALN